MPIREWRQPGYRLLAIFFATTFLLVCLLGWMGWQLVQQDRQLARQRLEERREHAADLAVAALKEHLTKSEALLSQLNAASAVDSSKQAQPIADTLPEDSLLMVLSGSAIEAFPAGRLLFYPEVPASPAISPELFSTPDSLEFQARDYPGAVARLRSLGRHSDAAIRAEAQARIGRCLGKAGKSGAALAAFDELARFGITPVLGLPAELFAREARLLILEPQKGDAAQREAAALVAGLCSGRWRINRAAFEWYMAEAERLLGPRAQPPALAASAAAESLWRQWQLLSHGEGEAAGRAVFRRDDQALLILWRASSERMAALALGRQELDMHWLRPLTPLLDPLGAAAAMTDSDGRSIAGEIPKDTASSVRLASVTGLPWTLHTVSLDPVQSGAAYRLILTGLGTLLLLILAGGYFIGRAAAREVAVARLQSDFVAAVSHEFRTPITGMRQLSELLASGRVADDQDRDEYYQALVRESSRLHRLVEGLLTFGRMEAGAMHFRFEELEVVAFTSEVVHEFQREAQARGYRVEFTGGAPAMIRADRAALGSVLWNLLDNAVKYSPEHRTVQVEAGLENGRAVLRVRDHGIGIPPGEQREIFKKFMRGAAARAGGIQGAGVGLSMAQQIVAAHKGEIQVASEPGQGSTFTVLLPLQGSRGKLH